MSRQTPRIVDVECVRIPVSIVEETISGIRSAGVAGFEQIALWAGRFSGPSAFDVELLIRPQQEAYRTLSGLIAQVDGDEIFRINRHVSDLGMRLLAQVHSHPDSAYHSETDDEFALVTARGSISVVVPSFGLGASRPGSWAVFRLVADAWQLLTSEQAERLLQVVEDD